MNRNLIRGCVAMALAMGSCVALAASGGFIVRGDQLRGDQLPDIQCSTTKCTLVQRPSPRSGAHTLALSTMATPAVADPTPVEVGPPPGQRFLYQGAGYPSCQSLVGVTPNNPYEYIKATSIPVPLGSTHISLLATVQANLSGGPAGSGADVGMLEVKRSSGSDWYIVNAGYVFTIYGSQVPQSLYNVGTYHGLVNLADLQDGTGVPSEIDVRVLVFPLNTTGFTNVVYNAVCWGNLQLSF